ncbi:DNA polymerase III subunit delta [Porphyrobacter algicida]|uniref:DNA polymerase III subunit delta n=1 Tax=Qipengyuania algicida TaxID=1836209 RepID=A0A845AKF3_9SPHN|nr:DNA polymerase III subunit delta [Qipengyuania algicida]
MKLTNRDFAAKARKIAGEASIFFFCGPDEAGASAAARDIAAMLPNPGERVELSGAELRGNPALLGDEARSTSLFGDKRHIWVRAAGDEALEALKTLIETGDAGGGEACPVIVVASAATDKSRTAKLLEKRGDAVVGMFYQPDLPAVTQTVRAMGDAAGVTLGGELAERIARAANLDVRLAQSEVDKLALYLDASPQAPCRADSEALDAVTAACEDDGFGPLVNCVLGGNTGALTQQLVRMRQLSLNPVGVLLAVERRAAQLARISAQLGPRGRFEDLDRGAKARLGIFFREERDIRAQSAVWRGRRLDRLTERLVGLHRDMLTNSQSSEVLLAQGLTQITREAARR